MSERPAPFQQPLRHGWGGDMQRRDRILRDRLELHVEQQETPIKFLDDIKLSVEDYELLEQMQRK